MRADARFVAAVLAGGALVLGALVGALTGLFGPPGAPAGPLVRGVTVAVAALGVLLALWHVSGSAGVEDTAEGARDGDDGGDAVRATTPEEPATDDPLSGLELSVALDEAAAAARGEWDVEAGVEHLRPRLRSALVDAMVRGGTDREAATAAVDDGSWTDDPVAAAVCSPAVIGPSLTFRERLYAWLFPERVLRERVRVTVGAIADEAAASLPSVPGERAPRTVPVVTPTVDDLRARVDGPLEPAADSAFESAAATATGADGADREGDGAAADGTATDGRRDDDGDGPGPAGGPRG